jgi:hypothetical protein
MVCIAFPRNHVVGPVRTASTTYARIKWFEENRVDQKIGKPDEDFSLTIAKRGEEGVPAAKFFDVEEPALESWNFTWYVE